MPETLTKTALIQEVIADLDREGAEYSRAEIIEVLDSTFKIIGENIAKGKKVQITGVLNFSFGKRRAIKKGTAIRNPLTGETKPHPGRPASLKLTVRPGPRLRECVPAPGTKVAKGLLAP
jgi:nucleoid DNA-binding protein